MVNQSPEQRAQTARQYEKIRLRFFFSETIISLFVVGIFSLAGPSKLLAEALEPLLGSGLTAVVIFTSLCLLGYTALFLPLDYLAGFRLEHRFELSNQGVGAWVKDQAKSFGLKLVLLNIFAGVLLVLLRTTGDVWWIWAGCFWLVFGILLSHLFPVLIMPLFYKIVPLTDGKLKDQLLALAQKVKVRVVGIYQFDMSKKTKKANALFTGLGRTKRIILGDTLLASFQDDEIEVILAHEMGHYVRRHVAKQIAGSTLMTFLGLWLVHLILNRCVSVLGLGSLAQIATLPLIGFLLSLLALIAMPLSNAYSRYCERQADRFALEQTENTKAFCASMEKLATQNLSNRDPHPLIEFFLYSHPSISKRIRAAEMHAARSTR